MKFMPSIKTTPDKELLVVPLSIEILSNGGKPAIQLRKVIKDKKLIKEICKMALNDDSVPAKIIIKDRFKAFTRLKNAGLI